jgi:hypothetical protein
MKIVEIDISEDKLPKDLSLEFKKQNLEEGDQLIIKSNKANQFIVATILVVVIIALAYYYKKSQDYANSVLKKVFDEDNIDDIEAEVEKRFGNGVIIENNEDLDWHKFSLNSLAKAYGESEPEYDLSMVKEPNPYYKQ